MKFVYTKTDDELYDELLKSIKKRAIVVSTAKEPYIYMRAVGTRELERILNKVFNKGEADGQI